MTLWTADEVAAFLRLSPSTVRRRIVCRSDFPKPVRMPGRAGPGAPRWVAGEVEEWVLERREVA